MTDGEVLQLFVEANPRPDETTPSAAEITKQFSDTISSDFTDVADRRGFRRGVGPAVGLIAAAITLAITVGLALYTQIGQNRQELATIPPSEVTIEPLASDHVAVAQAFIAARNAFDGADLEQLLDSARYVDRGREVEHGGFAAYGRWLEVMDSKLLSPQCRQTKVGVTCDYIVGDRLVEYAQVAATGRIEFTYDGDWLVSVTDKIGLGSYRLAFDPFLEWVWETHEPSEVQIWESGSIGVTPFFTYAAAASLDRRLAEYTVDPLTAAERYIEARNSFDSGALADVLGTGNIRASGRVLRQAELPFYFAWLKLLDWQLTKAECAPVGPSIVECGYVLDNRLTRFEGLTKPGTIKVKIEAGRVIASDDPFDVKTYDQDFFAPFYNWVRDNHRGSFDTMWLEFGGEASSRYSTESVQLFEELLTEYTGSP